jgi:predicted 3-demethylubiquinone-9 3-methyltransferase (glyoxalase superfamily)
MTKKIMPFLWFNDRIEEAVNFYVKTFKDAEIRKVDRYPDGRVLTIAFRLHDQEFVALNGGDQYKFTEAVSFQIDCKDQAEVDYYWDALLADGGREDRCSWLKDKYGLSWQVVPEALPRLLGSPDRAAAARAMEAMMKMNKIDVATLERAAAGM